MTLPISVVVPHIHSRKKFFEERCLPSILEERPAEVIIIPNDGSSGLPGRWRNAGFLKVGQPYVIFMDDDTIVEEGALAMLMDALAAAPKEVGYAYCDIRYRVAPGVVSRVRDGWISRAPEWSLEKLNGSNYVSNMSLVRTTTLPRPPYSEDLKRMVDWDLWIRMAVLGFRGVLVPQILFEAWQIDRGVSMSTPTEDATLEVKARHRL